MLWTHTDFQNGKSKQTNGNQSWASPPNKNKKKKKIREIKPNSIWPKQHIYQYCGTMRLQNTCKCFAYICLITKSPIRIFTKKQHNENLFILLTQRHHIQRYNTYKFFMLDLSHFLHKRIVVRASKQSANKLPLLCWQWCYHCRINFKFANWFWKRKIAMPGFIHCIVSN